MNGPTNNLVVESGLQHTDDDAVLVGEIQRVFEEEQWVANCTRWAGLNSEIINLICQIRDQKNSQDILVALFNERWEIVAPFLEAFNFRKEDYALATILTGGNCTFESHPHFAPPCGVEKLYQKLMRFRDYLKEMMVKPEKDIKNREVRMPLHDYLGEHVSIVALSHARLVHALEMYESRLKFRAETLDADVELLRFIRTKTRTESGQDMIDGELDGLRRAQQEIDFALKGLQALLPK